jgi:hypothetical protein
MAPQARLPPRVPAVKKSTDARPAAGAFAVSGVENGIFESGKPDFILPENAPTIGSVWIISPSN